jgi:hypothetical protein
MYNAIGTALSSPPDVSHSSSTKNFAISEEPDNGPDAEPNYDPSYVSLKDRSVVPPSSSLKVPSAQLHAIPNLTNIVSFTSFRVSIEPGGSRVAPIDVDNSHLPEPPVLEQAYGIELDSNSNPVSACMARVLEIVPDVEPDHLTQLVIRAVSTHGVGVLEHVLHVLFEDSKYPKIDAREKGKRKHADDEDKDTQAGSSKRPKVDFGYGDLFRAFKRGPDYFDLALVWNSSHHDMYTFRSKAGTSTRRLPFPPKGVSERIS